MKKGFLILEDGFTLEGKLFGKEAESLGEVVFNTSMSGYQEILTDPSYSGQIVTLTYPMIGNYGINSEDIESNKIQVSGLIVKELCKHHSNFRSELSLDKYLKDNNISAIEGIDTRKLTTHIRDKGALRGGVFLNKDKAIEKIMSYPQMNGLDLASKVSTNEMYTYHYDKNNDFYIAVIDFGVKSNILRQLKSQNFNIDVFPSDTVLRHISDMKYDGIFLSNGPGDPAAVKNSENLLNDIIELNLPCFGICLGHQLICRGFGATTYKLKFGHRGGNQPVKNLQTSKVEITSQNHGFAVDTKSIDSISDLEVTHINLNDDTIEGICHKKLPIFSVQYHPEAAPGPNDSNYLFMNFYDLIKRFK